MFPINGGWPRLDLWPGPDHWDGLPFVGFNVGISFTITEYYVNIASNHSSSRIGALSSLYQNSWAFRASPLPWLHSASEVNILSPLAHPLAWISPQLNSSASSLPHLLLFLEWFSILWLHLCWRPTFSCFQLDLAQNCEAVSLVAKSFLSCANYGHHLEQLPSEFSGLTSMFLKGIPQC